MAVADKVKSIIVEQLGVDEEEVTADCLVRRRSRRRFARHGGARDGVREEFGIEIPDEDAEKITRVKEAIEYIEAHAKTKK
jgi:acyl carrier protein